MLTKGTYEEENLNEKLKIECNGTFRFNWMIEGSLKGETKSCKIINGTVTNWIGHSVIEID